MDVRRVLTPEEGRVRGPHSQPFHDARAGQIGRGLQSRVKRVRLPLASFDHRGEVLLVTRGVRNAQSAGATPVTPTISAVALKEGARCSKCGWSKTNPTTGKVPLTVNHKDGDATHTVPENLELLCPNCHALTPNYGALNKGRGRKGRRFSAGTSR